jgi:hypothetical protein
MTPGTDLAVAVFRRFRYDRATAIEAARLSILYGIAMADSIMLATAQLQRAMLWDAGFGLRRFAGSQVLRQALKFS